MLIEAYERARTVVLWQLSVCELWQTCFNSLSSAIVKEAAVSKLPSAASPHFLTAPTKSPLKEANQHGGHVTPTKASHDCHTSPKTPVAEPGFITPTDHRKSSFISV